MSAMSINAVHRLAIAAGLAIALPVVAQTQSYLMAARGPLFTPSPDVRAIMLFSAQDGSLINPAFIRGTGALYEMDFPKDVLQVGSEIWVSDQTANVILKFDLLGNFLGSIHGNMANIRGMEFHDGTVYVTSAQSAGASPPNALVKFDAAGEYLGAFPVEFSPFDVIEHNGSLLVGHSSGSFDITRWGFDGTSLGIFHDGDIAFVSHLNRRANGNILAAGLSTPTGIYQYTPAGAQVGVFTLAGPRSAHELGNGNLLYSSSSGVHVLNTKTLAITTVTAFAGQFINPLTIDGGATGACCLPSGVCQVLSLLGCDAQNGVFRGAGTTCAAAACPAPGACCLANGTCVSAQPQACADLGGIWYGAGTLCGAGTCLESLRTGAATNSFINPDGAGVFIDLTASTDLVVPRIDYFPTPGHGVPVTVDIYTRPGSYVGFTESPLGWTLSETITTTSLGGTINPTRLTLANPIEIDQGQTVAVYLVGTIGGLRYRSSATTVANADLSLFSNEVRSAPFSGTTAVRGFSGAVFYSTGGACYANCDGSTASPILNVADFTCFLQRFAAGDPYANCDGSTVQPTLNVADFTCFLQSFAAGCS